MLVVIEMVMFRSFIEIGWAVLTNYWLRLSMFKHWTKHRTRDPFNLRWKSSTATAMKLSCKYSITNLILAGLVCLITRLWQKPDALDWNYAWLNMKFDGRLHSKWCQHLDSVRVLQDTNSKRPSRKPKFILKSVAKHPQKIMNILNIFTL